MSSYTAARIHAMRARLIQPDQYERLLKMHDQEIIGYLQSTEYREDVDSLAIRDLEDLEVIDRIIARNADRMIRKLDRISGPEFREAITGALMDNDVWNLKVIAEAIAGGEDAAEALRRYGRKGTLDPAALAGAKSIEELSQLAHLPIRTAQLADFIDALSTRRTPATGLVGLARKYLIDERNISMIIRMKRDGVAAERIIARLRKGTLHQGVLQAAAKAKDTAEAIAVLRSTKYSVEGDDMVRLEEELHRCVLQRIRRVSRQYPLGPAVLIRYLAEKEIEHENLRLLVKGRRLGMDDRFIREHLVV